MTTENPSFCVGRRYLEIATRSASPVAVRFGSKAVKLAMSISLPKCPRSRTFDGGAGGVDPLSRKRSGLGKDLLPR